MICVNDEWQTDKTCANDMRNDVRDNQITHA